MRNVGTKYAISAPMTAGADTLRRLGLKTEVKTDLSPEKTTAFQDLIISAHIPNGPSGE